MEDVGLTQTQLAKLLGVTQGAVAKVANYNPNGSSFLHKLARKLQTTPEYLTGEVDDPEANAPEPPALNYEQIELVECYDRMSPANRAALLQMARALAERELSQQGRLHDKPVGFRPESSGD